MSYLRNCAIAMVIAVPVALTGCLSEMHRLPTEPGPSAFQPSFTSVSVRSSQRATSNRFKYSDKGQKPTSGRNQGAHIELRALLDRNGMTTVEATTGSFDEGPSLARIDKVQLKVLNTGLPTWNEKPQARTWSRNVAGLTMGDQVQVMAHLRYSSGPGNQVVTLVTPVTRRPDVAVTGVGGASRAFLNTPVVFIATVKELNGDVGARANCLLTVDGVPSDQASGVWVDAMGVVNCQFSYIFRSVGTHSVQVTANRVAPGDFDLSNNSASTTIDIVTPGAPITFGTVQVQDEGYTLSTETVRTGEYPITGTFNRSQMLSSLNFFGTTVNVTERINRVEARLSADGAEVFSSTLNEISGYEYDDGFAFVRCIDYFVNGEQAQSCVSTYHSGGSSAWFFYAHSSGTVTYYGQTIYCATNGCDTFTPNDHDVTGTGERYGFTANSQVRLELSFIDAANLAHVIDRTIALTDRSDEVNYDTNECGPHFDGLGQVCTRSLSQGSFWFGITSWDETVQP